MKSLKNLDARLKKNTVYNKKNRDTRLISELGTLLLRARLEKGISQAELARRMQTQQPSIARVEGGLVSPTLKFLERMANALEIRIIITSEAVHKRTLA